MPDITPVPVQPFGGNVAIKSGAYGYLQGGTTAAVAQGVASLALAPIFIPRVTSFTRVGAEVTIIGDVGATMIIAIYNDDGTGAYPGALAFDSSATGSASTSLSNGLIDLHTASVQEITVAWTLPPGIYWAGSVCQNASHDGTAFGTPPTMRCYPIQPFSLATLATLPGANGLGNGLGFRQASVVGALPANFSTTISSSSATAPPRIIVKAA